MNGNGLILCLLIDFCLECRAVVDKDIRIDQFLVTSNVSMRFSEVTVHGIIRNVAKTGKEVNFDVILPKSAFISGFSLTVGNVKQIAEVKEKTVALDEYQQALKDNVTAGFVSQQSSLMDDFDRDKFRIHINISPNSSASFELQYQELIQRQGNRYKQKLYINPENTLSALDVIYEITESKAFKSFQYKTPLTDTLLEDSSRELDARGNFRKIIKWSPEAEDLTNHEFDENDAFDVVYDLEQLQNGGELITSKSGRFTHFFSTICDQEGVIPKKIMIVIDVSGSMSGIPISQVKAAMISILDQLKPEELFNMLFFSKDVKTWATSFLNASVDNIANAKRYLVRNLMAGGSTNINDAMEKALAIFEAEADDQASLYGQLIVLLTDGAPTYGVTNTREIREKVKSKNYFQRTECCKSSIFTVAFGRNSNKDLLLNLALENDGIAKIIKDKSDTANHKVLLEFFNEMENPYLRNVHFSYNTDGVALPRTNTTRTLFPLFDCGSELIVSGWTGPQSLIQPRIQAQGVRGTVTYENIDRKIVTEEQADKLEKLIVYKRVKELLEKIENSNNETIKKESRKRVVSLALDYSLVTPFTSMVVTSYRKRNVDAQSQNRIGKKEVLSATSTVNKVRSGSGGDNSPLMNTLDSLEFYENLENIVQDNSCFGLRAGLFWTFIVVSVSSFGKKIM